MLKQNKIIHGWYFFFLMPTGIKGILEDGKRNGQVMRVDNSHLTYSTHLLAADPNLCLCNRHGPSLAILCESNCLQEFTLPSLKLMKKKCQGLRNSHWCFSTVGDYQRGKTSRKVMGFLKKRKQWRVTNRLWLVVPFYGRSGNRRRGRPGMGWGAQGGPLGLQRLTVDTNEAMHVQLVWGLSSAKSSVREIETCELPKC